MNKKIVCALFFAAILLLGFGNDVRAASFFGKVVEINDGDLITVFNLNRPVKVRLLGIDAPELGQPFADIATEHLKRLALGRMVVVEYSGLGANSSVVGKVTAGGVDICAQMIRDGAAWFDLNNNSRLSETDRQIYTQSEVAARNERRGIWQSEAPIAPWDFVKTKLQLTTRSSTPSIKHAVVGRQTRPVELTPEEVLGPGYVRAGEQLDGPWTDRIARKWRLFEPAGQHFSVLVPEGGRRSYDQTLFGNDLINIYAYMVHDSWTMYNIIWLAGPHFGEPDEEAIPLTIRALLTIFSSNYSNAGLNLKCEARNEKPVKANAYTGQEFDLIGCHRPGMGRLYTKRIGDQRQFVLMITWFLEREPSVGRFFRSFKAVD